MMQVPGPIPIESNPRIHPEYYNPTNYIISAISSMGAYALVETSVNHNYVVGQLVRFHIPLGWGITQLNELDAYIIAIPSPNTFIANINISSYDPFVTPGPNFNKQNPQVSPIGDKNFGGTNSTGRIQSVLTIPGAFINVS